MTGLMARRLNNVDSTNPHGRYSPANFEGIGEFFFNVIPFAYGYDEGDKKPKLYPLLDSTGTQRTKNVVFGPTTDEPVATVATEAGEIIIPAPTASSSTGYGVVISVYNPSAGARVVTLTNGNGDILFKQSVSATSYAKIDFPVMAGRINALIDANGSGTYVTVQAWEYAKRQNYA